MKSAPAGTLLVVSLMMLASCSALPLPGSEPAARGERQGKDGGTEAGDATRPLPEARPQMRRPPAVVALLDLARADRAAGLDERAAVRLERALRIEPRDALIWLELARIHFDAGEFDTAAQFADQARRYAESDQGVRREAASLAALARSRAGREDGDAHDG